jgi:hypothetical protein
MGQRLRGSGDTHRSNVQYLPYIAVSVIGTALIYAARSVAAGETDGYDSHLCWRCPLGAFAAILFGAGQLCGVMSIALKKSLSFSLRRHDEPPAQGLLRFYFFVSAVSAFMLLVVVLWIAGLPQPRCLSESPACLRLQKNLQQKGWITLALLGLAGFQLIGTAAAARLLSLCCCSGVDDSRPAEAIDTPVTVVELTAIADDIDGSYDHSGTCKALANSKPASR